MKDLKLRVGNNIKTDDGREFTRLMGGFGEDKPVITTRQVSELMSLELRVVNQTISRNIKDFEQGLDIIDLKNSVTQSDSVLSTLKSLGYSNQAVSNSKNIYALSQSGFLLYLKFAEGDSAIELYKKFIEDYFKTKAENAVMKSTIEKQIEEWQDQRAFFLGKAIMTKVNTEKMEFMSKAEDANDNIKKLEQSLKAEEVKRQVVEKLQPQLHIAEVVGNIKGYYDVGEFSKVLGIERMGRNNMFKWMRNQKMLMKGNIPYQQHMKYFKVIPVVSSNGYKNSKTLLKPNGVQYIVKKLIDDGKVITRPIDEIVEELENIAQ